ncbi:MAG: dimethylarginine dimethylaminohydrolase family protein [Planctomycetota bacterium]|jgi:dimethylargininase
MLTAITREVSPRLAHCELSHVDRCRIDVDVAVPQHAAYCECLARLGCEVVSLPPDPELPDCVFVEDTAVVLDEAAIITRPGAPSRRDETAAIRQALARYRPLHTIEPPGTLDGGDVLRVGRTLYVGMTARSDADGIAQLQRHVGRYGYTVRPVPVSGCLHLKSACTAVGEDVLLINPDWVNAAEFSALQHINVHPDEPSGANALLVGGTVVCAAAFPRTRELLEDRGFPVETVDSSELAKAEGGLTCCSLLFES